MKKNEMYVAPELEILNVMIEAGFAGSFVDDDPSMPAPVEPEDE